MCLYVNLDKSLVEVSSFQEKRFPINEYPSGETQRICCGKSIPEEIKLHLAKWYIFYIYISIYSGSCLNLVFIYI